MATRDTSHPRKYGRRSVRLGGAGVATLAVWAAFSFFRPPADQKAGHAGGEALPASLPSVEAVAAPAIAEVAPSADEAPDASPALREEERTATQLSRQIAVALQHGDGEDREQALDSFLPALVELDSQAAVRLVSGWEAGDMRRELLRRLTEAWIEVDAAAAIRWLGTLDVDDRQSAATDAVNAVAQMDPAGAIAIAEVFGVGRENGVLQHLTQLWAAENLEAALTWVRGRPAGEARDLLMARVVLVQAESDPVKAAALVQQEINAGEIRDEALVSVARQWAVGDAVAALAWVARFPPGELRDRAKAEVEGTGKFPANEAP